MNEILKHGFECQYMFWVCGNIVLRIALYICLFQYAVTCGILHNLIIRKMSYDSVFFLFHLNEQYIESNESLFQFIKDYIFFTTHIKTDNLL